MINIRPALSIDLDGIADMCVEFWNSHTVYEEPCDWEWVREIANSCLEQGLLAVAETEDKLVGFLACTKAPLLGNPSVFQAAEIAWWVDKEYRHTTAGSGLLELITGMARRQGIKYFNMALMHSSMPEAVGAIYEKKGFRKNETYYMRVL